MGTCAFFMSHEAAITLKQFRAKERCSHVNVKVFCDAIGDGTNIGIISNQWYYLIILQSDGELRNPDMQESTATVAVFSS